eukprot:246413_1
MAQPCRIFSKPINIDDGLSIPSLKRRYSNHSTRAVMMELVILIRTRWRWHIWISKQLNRIRLASAIVALAAILSNSQNSLLLCGLCCCNRMDLLWVVSLLIRPFFWLCNERLFIWLIPCCVIIPYILAGRTAEFWTAPCSSEEEQAHIRKRMLFIFTPSWCWINLFVLINKNWSFAVYFIDHIPILALVFLVLSLWFKLFCLCSGSVYSFVPFVNSFIHLFIHLFIYFLLFKFFHFLFCVLQIHILYIVSLFCLF